MSAVAKKKSLDINHNFPSLKEAYETAKQQYLATVKKDRLLTAKLLRRMNKWLQEVIPKSVDKACYHVNYDPNQPYEYFSVCIEFPPDRKLYNALRKYGNTDNPDGAKTFKFKLTAPSRQNTVGLLEVDLITRPLLDSIPEHGYTDPGLYLQFSFVEW